jgi:hypothetical protein
MTSTCQPGSTQAENSLIVGWSGPYPVVARIEHCEVVEKVGRVTIIRHDQTLGGVYAQLKGRAFFDTDEWESTCSRAVESGMLPLGSIFEGDFEWRLFVRFAAPCVAEGTCKPTEHAFATWGKVYHAGRSTGQEYVHATADTVKWLIDDLKNEAGFEPSKFFFAAAAVATEA